MTAEFIIGTFYTMKYRTKVQAHEYFLEISKDSQKNYDFKLKLTVSGHFGSLGEEWIGSCRVENENLLFETREHIDWNFTFLDEERNEKTSKHNKTYTAEILREESDIKCILSMETITLIMYKSHESIKLQSYWFTQEIINYYHLDIEYGKYDDPGKFWRITNLVFRQLRENARTQEVEVICEYDLDTVKEEKRVVKADEVITVHHVDKVLFNHEHKIIKYEHLK